MHTLSSLCHMYSAIRVCARCILCHVFSAVCSAETLSGEGRYTWQRTSSRLAYICLLHLHVPHAGIHLHFHVAQAPMHLSPPSPCAAQSISSGCRDCLSSTHLWRVMREASSTHRKKYRVQPHRTLVLPQPSTLHPTIGVASTLHHPVPLTLCRVLLCKVLPIYKHQVLLICNHVCLHGCTCAAADGGAVDMCTYGRICMT